MADEKSKGISENGTYVRGIVMESGIVQGDKGDAARVLLFTGSRVNIELRAWADEAGHITALGRELLALPVGSTATVRVEQYVSKGGYLNTSPLAVVTV